MDALAAAWSKLPKKTRDAISPAGPCPDEYKLSAQEFDKLRQAPADSDDSLDSLNNQVIGNAAA
jgi:hypothetical protein